MTCIFAINAMKTEQLLHSVSCRVKMTDDVKLNLTEQMCRYIKRSYLVIHCVAADDADHITLSHI